MNLPSFHFFGDPRDVLRSTSFTEHAGRNAAMTDARSMVQAIERLHALKPDGAVVSKIACRHLPVVVEYATGIDEPIVAPDNGEQLRHAPQLSSRNLPLVY
jgi:hypothetical protein